MLVSTKNIKTARPSRKFNSKIIRLYEVNRFVSVSYHLSLPIIMKIHDMFYPSLLRKVGHNPLLGQVNKAPPPVIIDNEEE